MRAYVYAAELLCETCGLAQRELIAKDDPASVPADPDNEHSYDSGDYPKGPYDGGGGEADTPQHCGQCSDFLENDLTSEGRRYTAETIVRALAAVAETGKKSASPALITWADFYDLNTIGALIEALDG
jgi:hypothetical protein